MAAPTITRTAITGTTPYGREIAAAAAAHQLSPELLEAQVVVESSGHADAFRFEPGILAQLQAGQLKPKRLPANPVDRRIASSYGLLQILYVTACDYGFAGEPEELFVPAIGLDYGARHLATLLAWAHGDYAQAFAVYNGGHGGNGSPPFRNQAYADRVFAARDHLGAGHDDRS